MSDQATVLRELIERRPHVHAQSAVDAETTRACSVAITSGKGGVGKSNIALNVAIAIAEVGPRVCLVDANRGLGNIDLLCRLNGYWNLEHVLTGARSVPEICLKGPVGVTVIPGAHCINAGVDCPEAARTDILRQLDQIERTHDFVIIDTATGIHRQSCEFVTSADAAVVVTTPEPTSIADAYALLKSMSSSCGDRIHLLVNQARSSEQAQAVAERLAKTSRLFLRAEFAVLEPIPQDFHVCDAVVQRTPFLIHDPDCAATRAVRRLARRLVSSPPQPQRSSYFEGVWQRGVSRAA